MGGRGQGFFQAAEEGGVVFSGEGVFPDAEDAPAGAAQGSVDEAVAVAVGGEFFAPVGAVARGPGAVPGAGVPEAAVHKQGEPELGKDEIGAHFESARTGIWFGRERTHRTQSRRAVCAKGVRPARRTRHSAFHTPHFDVSSPAGDFLAAQDGHEGKLGLLVPPAANPRHHLGTFLLCEDVGHGSSSTRQGFVYNDSLCLK
ncbi:MAG: hypothetical protein JWQ04_546 [Pedosphaera sp.]|nr:hypothetical protein [Pedosphaera sp.]